MSRSATRFFVVVEMRSTRRFLIKKKVENNSEIGATFRSTIVIDVISVSNRQLRNLNDSLPNYSTDRALLCIVLFIISNAHSPTRLREIDDSTLLKKCSKFVEKKPQ